MAELAVPVSVALCHKLDVKNGFAYVLQFFSHISDSLGSVDGVVWAGVGTFKVEFQDLDFFNNIIWWRPLIRLTKQVRLQNFRNSGMNELCLISNLVCVKNS